MALPISAGGALPEALAESEAQVLVLSVNDQSSDEYVTGETSEMPPYMYSTSVSPDVAYAATPIEERPAGPPVVAVSSHAA